MWGHVHLAFELNPLYQFMEVEVGIDGGFKNSSASSRSTEILFSFVWKQGANSHLPCSKNGGEKKTFRLWRQKIIFNHVNTNRTLRRVCVWRTVRVFMWIGLLGVWVQNGTYLSLLKGSKSRVQRRPKRWSTFLWRNHLSPSVSIHTSFRPSLIIQAWTNLTAFCSIRGYLCLHQ